MKKLKNMLFSMELTGMLLILFAVSAGVATFIENDFGTITAKAKVYNAKWFELLLLLLAVNMTGSIFKHKMYLKHKWPVLLFHVSFLVIFIGAAVTRYIGYEGMMSIREGQTSDEMITDETYIRIWADDGIARVYEEHRVLATPVDITGFSETFEVVGEKVNVKVENYYVSAGETYVEGEGGEPLLWLVVSSGQSGRQNLYLKQGLKRNFGGVQFTFDTEPDDGKSLAINFRGGQLFMQSSDSIKYMNMMAGSSEMLAPDNMHEFLSRALYEIDGVSIVLKEFYESAVTQLVSTESKGGMDAVQVKVSVGQEWNIMAVYGGKGILGRPVEKTIGGVKVSVSYGAKPYKLPFTLKLVDFQLERYPGSNSPSSYASQVVVIDESKNLEMPYRIYMNNVLNYRGYRFFQSSYDRDEMGTILSVNHDAAGTIITYFGYFIMTIGMVVALFHRSGRLRTLMRQSRRIRGSRKSVTTVLLLLGFLMGGFSIEKSYAQSSANQIPVIDKEHAAEFGRLLVQGMDGRIEPVNTMASEVLRKIARKTSFQGQNPEQVFLGIMVFPEIWEQVPFIKVTHPELMNYLGVEGNLARFDQIVDLHYTGSYRLREYMENAYAKKPAMQSKFDKEVIKVDERVNIFYMVYTGTFLASFPLPDDENNKWVTSAQFNQFKDEEESLFVKGFLSMYFNEVAKAAQTGDWESADQHLEYIKQFQKKYGIEVIPSESKINLEIFYNQFNPFKRLAHYYLYVGFVLLILHFINILKPRINLGWITRIASVLVIILFLIHTAGLIMRWNISGHAPWSNGYESLIYIAWATALAGLVFVRRSQVTLSVTALLASLTLSVAGMSWMDPEITTLVPVLKSYWLIIHVAIITASYGFLALGALLGFFNLILMILKSGRNYKRLNLTLTELSYIIEMTLIIGLFMLTIGTFLGGVWANESWGRYWGWDPKETWALVTILVYSFIVHMRFIPGFRGNFALSFASLIGYSSVLMTYFGVNYYLSGLHSYAAGDPVPIPTFVYYTLAVVAVVSTIAYFTDKKFGPRISDESTSGDSL